MNALVRQAIARIDVAQAGTTASRGTGFLVAPDLVLTAFHVVADRAAAGLVLYPGRITLTFPTHTTEATVVPDRWDPRSDWILLRCAVPPPAVRPIPLADNAVDAMEWETYGFPDANPRDGMVQIGSIENAFGSFEGMHAYQLFSRQAAAGSGAPVKGLSGGPVMVDGAIVGLLRSSLMREGQNVAGTLYGCPLDVIVDRCADLLPIPDPCRGLPGLPRRPLPAAPFRFLERFRAEDAEVFWGRNRELRQLYDAVTSQDGARVVLLYGQSGAGKSSVLDAGLLPRLETTHAVVYLRRDRTRGLLATVLDAIGLILPAASGARAIPAVSAEAVRLAWLGLETATGRPLVVVLDQVEEAFTLPIDAADELSAFIDALTILFGPDGVRGRLVLGFRKEWFAEIQKQIEARSVEYRKVFFETLNYDAVVEIVAGGQRTKRLRERYGLTIEPRLAEAIARDLTADRDSPVAPTLQVLLSRMWREATAASAHAPQFTLALYERVRNDGFLLSDFLDQQLTALGVAAGTEGGSKADVVASGLAIDLLAFYVTPMITAEQRTAEDIANEYQHRGNDATWLVQELKRLYLLSDPTRDAAHHATGARLSHDTLARAVRARLDGSLNPGQRSRRVLENRAAEWTGAADGTPLDHRDLSLVESGLHGMRSLRPAEQRLLTASRTARAAQFKARTRRRAAAAAAIAAVLLATAVAAWLGLENQRQLKWRELLSLDARVPALLSLQPVAGLVTAIEAVDGSLIFNDGVVLPSIQSNLAGALNQARERFVWRLEHSATAIAFSTDGRVAAGTSDGTIQLFRLDGAAEIAPIRAAGSLVTITGVTFADGGDLVAAALGRQGVGVWDRMGQPLPARPELPDGMATAISFVPGSHTLVVAFQSADSHPTLYIDNLDETAPTRLPIAGREPITSLATARNSRGELLIAIGAGDLRLVDGSGKVLLDHIVPPQGAISAIDLRITADRRVLLAYGSSAGTVMVYDAVQKELLGPFGRGAEVISLAFGRGQTVIAGGSDGIVHTFNMQGDDLAAPFAAAAGGVAALAVSPDGQYAAVSGGEAGGRYVRVIDTVSVEVHFPLRHSLGDDPREPTAVNSLTFLPGNELLVAGLAPNLGRWKIAIPAGSAWSDAKLTSIDAAQQATKSVAADDAGNFVVVGDGGIQFRDAAGTLLARANLSAGVSVAITRDGTTAAVGDDAGNVTLWDVKQHRLTKTLAAHAGTVWTVAFAPGDSGFASGGADGAVKFWRVDGTPAGGLPASTSAGTAITAVVYHPDGTLFVASDRGRVERRAANGGLLSSVTVFRDAVITALATDVRGETLFVASARGVQWVDVESGALLSLAARGMTHPIRALAVSRDGQLLAGAAGDGDVYLWRVGWREWLAEACARLRNHDAFLSLSKRSTPPDACRVPGVNCQTAYNACLTRVWTSPRR